MSVIRKSQLSAGGYIKARNLTATQRAKLKADLITQRNIRQNKPGALNGWRNKVEQDFVRTVKRSKFRPNPLLPSKQEVSRGYGLLRRNTGFKETMTRNGPRDFRRKGQKLSVAQISLDQRKLGGVKSEKGKVKIVDSSSVPQPPKGVLAWAERFGGRKGASRIGVLNDLRPDVKADMIRHEMGHAVPSRRNRSAFRLHGQVLTNPMKKAREEARAATGEGPRGISTHIGYDAMSDIEMAQRGINAKVYRQARQHFSAPRSSDDPRPRVQMRSLDLDSRAPSYKKKSKKSTSNTGKSTSSTGKSTSNTGKKRNNKEQSNTKRNVLIGSGLIAAGTGTSGYAYNRARRLSSGAFDGKDRP